MLLSKRYPGEIYDPREFVRPESYMVRMTAARLHGTTDRQFVESAWAFVANDIEYPSGQVEPDRHEEAFTLASGRVIRRASTDFWQFPTETLALRIGDCEDKAILLCSILRTRLPPEECCVAVGRYRDMGHSWVMLPGRWGGIYLETVLEPGFYSASQLVSPYSMDWWFNDKLCGVGRI